MDPYNIQEYSRGGSVGTPPPFFVTPKLKEEWETSRICTFLLLSYPYSPLPRSRMRPWLYSVLFYYPSRQYPVNVHQDSRVTGVERRSMNVTVNHAVTGPPVWTSSTPTSVSVHPASRVSTSGRYYLPEVTRGDLAGRIGSSASCCDSPFLSLPVK